LSEYKYEVRYILDCCCLLPAVVKVRGNAGNGVPPPPILVYTVPPPEFEGYALIAC